MILFMIGIVIAVANNVECWVGAAQIIVSNPKSLVSPHDARSEQVATSCGLSGEYLSVGP